MKKGSNPPPPLVANKPTPPPAPPPKRILKDDVVWKASSDFTPRCNHYVSHHPQIENMLLILVETTLDDFPDATIMAWLKKAVDRIEKLKAEVKSLNAMVDSGEDLR